jgi:hypothetical protein
MATLRERSESAVLIDETALDKECIRLPSDYLKFAHLSAEAKRDVNEAEAALSVIKADLSKKIRSKPDRYGIDKVTETAITFEILLQDDYKEAEEAVNTARHRYEMAQAVVWAMEHKKRALSLLVDLHGAGYFSSPKLTRAGKEVVEEMVKTRVRRGNRED